MKTIVYFPKYAYIFCCITNSKLKDSVFRVPNSIIPVECRQNDDILVTLTITSYKGTGCKNIKRRKGNELWK